MKTYDNQINSFGTTQTCFEVVQVKDLSTEKDAGADAVKVQDQAGFADTLQGYQQSQEAEMHQRKKLLTNADLPLAKAQNGAVNFSFGNTMLKNKALEKTNQYQDAARENENIQHFIRSKNNSYYKLDLSRSISDQPVDVTTEEQDESDRSDSQTFSLTLPTSPPDVQGNIVEHKQSQSCQNSPPRNA